jgi:hypothetical protein
VSPFRSLLNQSFLGLGILSLLTLVGCGYGNGGTVTLPHPSGNYSVISLNGSYVYRIHGTSQFGPYRELGVFTADGAGRITAGSDDFDAGALTTNNITGTYQVNSDGTGFIFLNSTGLGQTVGLTQITLAITLVSSSKLNLIEADSRANAAGVAELQTSTSAPSGAFVFRLHQIAALPGQNPVAEVGAMTISGGAITSGNMDQNLAGSSSQLTLGGSFGTPSSLGRGTGSFVDSTNFTDNFVYYVVRPGKVVFLLTNAGAVGSGSAEAQTGAVGNGLSGSYAFGSRGDIGILYDSVASAGQLTAAGGTISTGSFDAVQLGNYLVTPSVTGTATPAANGRVTVAYNSSSVSVQQVFWMVSPSRAFFLTNDPGKVEDGTADLQTVSSFATSTMNGQFSVVMDGIDLTPELLSRIGALQFNGAGTLTLAELVNASGSSTGAQSPGILSGPYQVSSNGRITGSFNGGSLNLVMYAVSGSDAYVIQADSGTNTSGTLELQH